MQDDFLVRTHVAAVIETIADYSQYCVEARNAIEPALKNIFSRRASASVSWRVTQLDAGVENALAAGVGRVTFEIPSPVSIASSAMFDSRGMPSYREPVDVIVALYRTNCLDRTEDYQGWSALLYSLRSSDAAFLSVDILLEAIERELDNALIPEY